MSGQMSKLFQDKLGQFSGEAPLLPLPNVVFYPKTFLPLHIREPRHQKLVQHVEQGERVICLALLKEGRAEDDRGLLPVHSLGTLGFLEMNKLREDGTSDILVVGVSKVLIHEIRSDKDYPMARVSLQTDAPGERDIEPLQNKIFQQFQRLVTDDGISSLVRYFKSGLNFEMAVNFIAAHLPVNIHEKQKLLELNDLSMRANVLIQFMESEIQSRALGKGSSFSIPGDPRKN